ncbi:Vacuolar protein sorting-associated protein 53 A [Vitis vinifera]|uniref:Vacuolar protein sorting-associated protein 53 A n=1 Tax=Vitis vinifera TaxID=29760 RepID=A0A438JWT6_VITVI|nr:Vacuolar protein sorting-associated protein 53 A [Vitis vinifera]
MDKSSALEYINQMFPTEASLSGVEPLMQKIHSEIRRVDAGILAAVRQQSNSGTKAKEDLAAATHAVELGGVDGLGAAYNLCYVVLINWEANGSISGDVVSRIDKLFKDFLWSWSPRSAEKTLSKWNLPLVVSAVEQLQVMASKRQYKEAAAQLEAVNQLCSHFEAYRDVPKITELREKFKNIKQILKSHVFSDFSRTTLCYEHFMNMKNFVHKPKKGFHDRLHYPCFPVRLFYSQKLI